MTLVLGLGNPILGDDAAGLMVAGEIKKARPDIDVKETSGGALDVAEAMAGHENVFLVDAITLPGAGTGEIFEFSLDEFSKTIWKGSPHDISLAAAVELCAQAGCEMPSEISIVCINIEPGREFTEAVSPRVRDAILHATNVVLQKMGAGA